MGGDYFDVLKVNEACWAVAVADVSGKGVSSALLACYLQGALSAASHSAYTIERTMELINRFLGERAEAGKYATVFHCTLRRARAVALRERRPLRAAGGVAGRRNAHA